MEKNKKKILIVEDQRIIALDLKNMLVRKGYHITGICDRGEDVIKAMNDKKPDLILMDILLKGKLNGIETAKSINKKYNVPIIYLTALTDVDTYLRAMKTEHKKYLMKPLEIESLERAIEEAFTVN
jgi:DNA-binding NtrC family response regulator